MIGRLYYDQKVLIENELKKENLNYTIEEEYLPYHNMYFYKFTNGSSNESVEIEEKIKNILLNSIHNCKVYFNDYNQKFYLTVDL